MIVLLILMISYILRLQLELVVMPVVISFTMPATTGLWLCSEAAVVS